MAVEFDRKGSLRKVARLLLANMGGDQRLCAKIETLLQAAVFEAVMGALEHLDSTTPGGIEAQLDTQVDRHLSDLCRDGRLWARDDRDGHLHRVVLKKGL